MEAKILSFGRMWEQTGHMKLIDERASEKDDSSKVEVTDTITIAANRLAPKHEIGTLSRAMR